MITGNTSSDEEPDKEDDHDSTTMFADDLMPPEAKEKQMDWAIDPRFENAEIVDHTGIYPEEMRGWDPDSQVRMTVRDLAAFLPYDIDLDQAGQQANEDDDDDSEQLPNEKARAELDKAQKRREKHREKLTMELMNKERAVWDEYAGKSEENQTFAESVMPSPKQLEDYVVGQRKHRPTVSDLEQLLAENEEAKPRELVKILLDKYGQFK
jgi:hypothetical protein